MEDQMTLSIIVLNWNTKELLKQCIESLVSSIPDRTGKYHVLRIEIIVVDNGSTDGSQEMIRKYIIQNTKYKIRLIENKENLGFAKGNNIGIKQAKGDYIMLLNSDTIVKEGAIEKMVNFLDCHSEIAAVGPKLLNTDGSTQANCGRFPDLSLVFIMLFKEHFGGSDFVRRSPTNSMYVDWLMGAAFMARKKVFEKCDGLDENIFMYMEEVEWFYRINKAGFKTYFLKEAEITHLGRGSSKSGKTEPILHIYKGLIHFYKKHKNSFELFLLMTMLKFKAVMAYILGIITNNVYLKETYGKAFKIS